MPNYDLWIESHVDLGDHPKVHLLSRTLSVPYPYAIGTLHCLWWYAMRFAWRDGDLSKYGDDAIEGACKWSGERGTLIKALRDCGFIDGSKVHDWIDFAGRLVKDRLRYERTNVKRTSSVRTASVIRTPSVANRTVPNRTVPNLTKDNTPHTPLEKPYVKPDRETNPVGFLVYAYKVKKGVPKEDRQWDKVQWRRCSKSATQLLATFAGDVVAAVNCIDELGDQFGEKELSWTLETVLKHAHDWKLKQTEADDDSTGSERSFDDFTHGRPESGRSQNRGLVAAGKILTGIRNMPPIRSAAGSSERIPRTGDDGSVDGMAENFVETKPD